MVGGDIIMGSDAETDVEMIDNMDNHDIAIISSDKDSDVDTSSSFLPLERDDIIIEKMHLHHGMKHLNPVNNMRFFPKGADPATYIARR